MTTTHEDQQQTLNQAMGYYEEALGAWRAGPPPSEEERALRLGERLACWEIIGGLVSADGRA
jgi:hypothetical protein